MLDFWHSLRLSRPQVKTLHGVEIRKLPVGRYLDVMSTMGSIVQELLDAAFPGQTPQQILHALTEADKAAYRALFDRLLVLVPEKALALLAAILGTETAHLRNDLTPNELLEVWTAFWKANDMTDFFAGVRNAIPPALRKTKTTDGYSASSPGASASASASAS